MVRAFLNYSCHNDCCKNETKIKSSNLLVIFTDPDDPETEEPMQYIFGEALRIACRTNNVHWIRAKPSMQTPKILKDAVLKPNDLARIHLHYGFDELPSLVRLFCSKTLFVNALTCSALFVELQNSWHFTNFECANLLAQLCMVANWMSSRQSLCQQPNQQHFPVIVVLRDRPQHYQIASIYSSHILRWRTDTDWTDLLVNDGRKWAENAQN